jgi:pimeloyl-ACP methyl ester carboxylesterase
MPSPPSATPLAHDRTGAGEALVLIHPLGGDRGVWEPVTPLLAERFDVIAIDLPGFGESPELTDEVEATAPVLAASVIATLDALGIERAHVVGNSLGGWVALEVAKTDRCLSVTGLCPAGFWPRPLGPRPELARRTARALVPALVALLRTERGRGLVLRGPVAHPERVPPAAARRLVRAYALSPGFDRANAEMRKTLFEGFDEIDVPITLAWAEHDRLVSPPRTVPAGIETALLRDCGHVPTWDDPQRVAEVIEAGAARAATQPVGTGPSPAIAPRPAQRG